MEKKLQEIKKAQEMLGKLNLPEHLQSAAFTHLLSDSLASFRAIPSKDSDDTQPSILSTSNAGGLRAFIAQLQPKGAVEEIPTLMYWAKLNEKKESLNEDEIVQLYRRAGIRPPKNVAQSLRDLSSKRYGRLEAVAGQKGFVRLGRVGEDFVLYDVIEKNRT